jgi:hypothetical protein|tara:strand:- start:109 stop:399 length:291 start_codon:yes stop_codon:yes gene_type:complete
MVRGYHPKKPDVGDLIRITPPYGSKSIEALDEDSPYEVSEVKSGAICMVLRITGNFYGDDIYHLKCMGEEKIVEINDYVNGMEWCEIISEKEENTK